MWRFDLRRSAISAIAPDLPIEDPTAGLREYAQVVVEALGDVQNVVVVGHSLGGLTVPVVASLRPIARMVFLAGMIPEPGESFADFCSAHPRRPQQRSLRTTITTKEFESC
jgi:pimeloyl-ACP methyl ester carboxylesterase